MQAHLAGGATRENYLNFHTSSRLMIPRGRFVSLLPSATEILGGLGLAQHVVGVTHECDVCPDNSGTYQPDSHCTILPHQL